MISSLTEIGTETTLIGIFKEIAWRIGQHYNAERSPAITLNYLYGPESDIISVINEQGRAAEKKYPLLALLMPFTEICGNGFDTSFNDLKLLIGTNILNPEQHFASRWTANYLNKLLPIYDYLLASIAESGYFREVYPEKIVHNQIIASNGKPGNVLPDWIDFIWIEQLKLNQIGKDY